MSTVPSANTRRGATSSGSCTESLIPSFTTPNGSAFTPPPRPQALSTTIIGNAAVFAGALASLALLPNALGSSLRQLEAKSYQTAMQFASNPSCMMEDGFDFRGNDFANVRGHYNECCDKCINAYVDCTAWTWTDFNGGTCWLKTGRGEVVRNAAAKSGTYFGDTMGSCNNRADLDIVGSDLKRVNGATAADCCEPCRRTMGCEGYTWSNDQGGSCWLKTRVTEIAFKAGVQSSMFNPIMNLPCRLTQLDQDIEGNDIANRRSTTPKGCCEICQTIQGCRAYSWTDYQGGTCWLKSAYGVPVRKVGVVSAPVNPRF